MLANFTKDEFHQFIMLYLEEQINNRWELVREIDNEAWYDFLEQLDMKQMMTVFVRSRPKYTGKVRNYGKHFTTVLQEKDGDEKVQVMI